MFRKIFSFLPLLFVCFSCTSIEKEDKEVLPNILFAIADDQSFPHAGAYGCNWVNTPAFDRIAKEGLLFTKAYTSNAKCAPSRASILTGRNSWLLEEAANHWPNFPEKFKTFPEVLQEAGYFVGRTGKGWAPGIAEKNGKPRELIGENYIEHKLIPPTHGISDNDYAENFSSFLKVRDQNKPFFFWYGSIEPHRDYEFESGIKKGNKLPTEITQVPPFWPDVDSIRTDMLDYAFEIEHFDHHLEKMIKTLEESGELNNTIIIVTSDNGMPFPRIKGQIYEYDNHLPLAIMWGKGIKNPGRIIDHYVNFTDFTPTILDLIHISLEDSGMLPVNGQSLMNMFKDTFPEDYAKGREFVLIGKERHDIGRPNDEGYPVRGIIKNDLVFSQNFKPERWPAGNPETGYLNTDGSPTKTVILNEKRRKTESIYWDLSFGKRNEEELYDLSKDPFCMINVANDSTYLERKTALKALMYDELMKQGDPRILGNGDIFDHYRYADIKTVDFYTRFKNGEKIAAGWVNKSDFEPTENESDQ